MRRRMYFDLSPIPSLSSTHLSPFSLISNKPPKIRQEQRRKSQHTRYIFLSNQLLSFLSSLFLYQGKKSEESGKGEENEETRSCSCHPYFPFFSLFFFLSLCF